MSTADSISRQGRILALLAALSTLFACASVGPDFEEPTVDWLADWQTDLYGQVAKSEQSEADLRNLLLAEGGRRVAAGRVSLRAGDGTCQQQQ